MIGCGGDVTTAQTRGLFTFPLATMALRTALGSQLRRLATRPG